MSRPPDRSRVEAVAGGADHQRPQDGVEGRNDSRIIQRRPALAQHPLQSLGCTCHRGLEPCLCCLLWRGVALRLDARISVRAAAAAGFKSPAGK